MIELRRYVDREGRNAFDRWFLKLDNTTQVQIGFSLDRSERGSLAAKWVGAGVLELRVNPGPGYRVYFGEDGKKVIILLGGGTKKREQVDIETAQELGKSTNSASGRDNATYSKF